MMTEGVAVKAVPTFGESIVHRLDATDEAIAQHRDAASFGELYRRHVEAVYRYTASRVAERAEAEDITSEVFHRAWSSFGSYRATATFRAWLFGVTRKTIADHYRRQKPTIRLLPEVIDQLVDADPNPEERALSDDLQRLGRDLLARLKPEQQEVLALRFAAGLSYPEIAQVMNKREDAVKKTAYRALDEMKRGLTS
jgi:RNA polymerase sigma-70 factor (ECF subfamily)